MKASGFLIDLDGVLYVQETLIPGALETVEILRSLNIPHRFVTNTSTINRRQLAGRLQRAGLAITEEHLFTAPLAAARFLREQGNTRCFLFASRNLVEDLGGIELVDSKPTHILIGDMGDGFSYENLNNVFRMIKEGAEILALQRNRYWLTSEGITLDAGAFIAALEFATEKESIVFGKPSPQFFLEACTSLGMPPQDIVMIGDDYKVDIVGAKDAGLQAVFVRTGKDKGRDIRREIIQPDHVLSSIADLRLLLGGRIA